MTSRASGKDSLKQFETKTQESLTGFDTLSPDMAMAVNYPRWIVQYFHQYIHGDVLEVGLGFANYRNLYNVESYTGCDIDSDVVVAAKAALPNDVFFEADMESEKFVPRALASNQGTEFDTVISFNALQYVNDEYQAISNLLTVTKPGGFVCLLVPAHQFMFGELDRKSGHRYRYSKKHLCESVEPNLGSLIKIRYFNSVGGLGWGVTNMLSPGKDKEQESSHSNDSSILFFDRFLLPFSRILQPFTQHFFGLSHAVIIERVK